MHGYPQFSFWVSITLVEICFSHIFIKPRKNTFALVGNVLNYISVFLSHRNNKVVQVVVVVVVDQYCIYPCISRPFMASKEAPKLPLDLYTC